MAFKQETSQHAVAPSAREHCRKFQVVVLVISTGPGFLLYVYASASLQRVGTVSVVSLTRSRDIVEAARKFPVFTPMNCSSTTTLCALDLVSRSPLAD